MKRAVFEEKSSRITKKVKLTKNWLNRIHEYKSSAVSELSAIYSSLMNQKKVENPSLGKSLCWTNPTQYILFTESDALIYSLSPGIVKYGPKEQEYPISDKSLWPWKIRQTTASLIPKDVVILICMKMRSLADLSRMRLVCQKWRKWIDESEKLWTRVRDTHPIRCFYQPTRDFYMSLPKCPKRGTKGPRCKKFIMNLPSLDQQIMFFASMYAPLEVDAFELINSPAYNHNVCSVLQYTRNRAKSVEKCWCIKLKGIESKLYIFTQTKTVTFYVEWGGFHLTKTAGISAMELCNTFRRLVSGSLPKGRISHWNIK